MATAKNLLSHSFCLTLFTNGDKCSIDGERSHDTLPLQKPVKTVTMWNHSIYSFTTHQSEQFCLKGHVALDRSSWSMKIIWNHLVVICIWLKRCLTVEYNDPHKHDSKLRGFPFTLRTDTVGRFMESKTWLACRVSSWRTRKTTQFRGMFEWIIIFYF